MKSTVITSAIGKALGREFLSLYTGQGNCIEVKIGSGKSFVGVFDHPK